MNATAIVVEKAIPIVLTSEIVAARDFLVERLGFTDGWTYDYEGVPVYGGASLGGQPLHLSHHPSPPEGETFAYVLLRDVDAYHTLVADVPGVGDPGDRPYRMRDFRVTLPGGGGITFGSDVC